MTKLEALQNINFGGRVAEDETSDLAKYFVETEQWRMIYGGEVDIVYGAKGSGKSALYSLLVARAGDLFDRSIIVIPSEKPRGAPAFKGLVSDPPTTELEFTSLWKLYFLSLIGEALRDYGASSAAARRVMAALKEAGLLQDVKDLRSLLHNSLNYVRKMLNRAAIEASLTVAPDTGLPTVTGKITLGEPTATDASVGFISLDGLYELADQGLSELGATAWILLDRLDVAFTETRPLEENALRALFKVYLDMLGMSNIRMKVFLRTDLWKRITAQGFREASHITRVTTIKWDEPSLLNLVAKRILQNDAVFQYIPMNADNVMRSLQNQYSLFYDLFPGRIGRGPDAPLTFDWILTRTRDGFRENAPRELIHLLTAARGEQIRLQELGEQEPKSTQLFSPSALTRALPEVSKVRLEQTLFAEYPSLRDPVTRLTGGEPSQNLKSLARIWRVSREDALVLARELIEVGFFEPRGMERELEFWVPFLYRDALKMSQGEVS